VCACARKRGRSKRGREKREKEREGERKREREREREPIAQPADCASAEKETKSLLQKSLIKEMEREKKRRLCVTFSL